MGFSVLVLSPVAGPVCVSPLRLFVFEEVLVSIGASSEALPSFDVSARVGRCLWSSPSVPAPTPTGLQPSWFTSRSGTSRSVGQVALVLAPAPPLTHLCWHVSAVGQVALVLAPAPPLSLFRIAAIVRTVGRTRVQYYSHCWLVPEARKVALVLSHATCLGQLWYAVRKGCLCLAPCVNRRVRVGIGLLTLILP